MTILRRPRLYSIPLSLLVILGTLEYCDRPRENNTHDFLGGTYRVNVKPGLALRDKPNAAGAKLTTIQTKAVVEVLEQTGKGETLLGLNGPWLKVQYEKHTGYVYGPLLSRPDDPKKPFVVRDGIALPEGLGSDPETEKRLRAVEKWTTLPDGWAKMTFPGKREIAIEGLVERKKIVGYYRAGTKQIALRITGIYHWTPTSAMTRAENILFFCTFAEPRHAYEFSTVLECRQSVACTWETHQFCLPKFRLYDPASINTAPVEFVFNGVPVVTTGWKKARTTRDVFLRKGPSRKHASVRVESCTADDDTRLARGEEIVTIARTKAKENIDGREDYWYYAGVGMGDCATGWSERHWVFGEFLDFNVPPGE